jgi:hypothetical protein
VFKIKDSHLIAKNTIYLKDSTNPFVKAVKQIAIYLLEDVVSKISSGMVYSVNE